MEPFHLWFPCLPGKAHDVHKGGWQLSLPVVVDAADVITTVHADNAIKEIEASL